MSHEFWPGSNTRKSLHNAFTLGYSRSQPHGYVPGEPILQPKPKAKHRRRPGGFGSNSGTLHGLGRRPNAPTMMLRKKHA